MTIGGVTTGTFLYESKSQFNLASKLIMDTPSHSTLGLGSSR